MWFKISIVFFFSCFTSLVCNKKPIVLTEAVSDLPPIDVVNNIQCVVRYKNSLHDNNYMLTFKLRVIYFDPVGLEILGDNSFRDSIIINNLNRSFFTQNINFTLEESNSDWNNESINTFFAEYEKFVKDGVITIVVYSNSLGATYNGIAAGIPHTVMGILESKIGTSTLSHEAGHLLGIPHIFEKDDTDGRNSNTGDKICDTPYFNIMDNITDSCGYVGKRLYSDEDLKIIIPNYLNYNSKEQDCRDRFTPVQSLVMRWHIENYPPLYSALVY